MLPPPFSVPANFGDSFAVEVVAVLRVGVVHGVLRSHVRRLGGVSLGLGHVMLVALVGAAIPANEKFIPRIDNTEPLRA